MGNRPHRGAAAARRPLERAPVKGSSIEREGAYRHDGPLACPCPLADGASFLTPWSATASIPRRLAARWCATGFWTSPNIATCGQAGPDSALPEHDVGLFTARPT